MSDLDNQPEVKVYKTFSLHDFSGYKEQEILRSLEIFDDIEKLPRPLQIVEVALRKALEVKQNELSVTSPKVPRVIKMSDLSQEDIERLKASTKPIAPTIPTPEPKILSEEEKAKLVNDGASLRNLMGRINKL